MIAELDPANSVVGAEEGVVHISPSPYMGDIDEMVHLFGNSSKEREHWRGVLNLLASTELITNDIEVLLQGFAAETVMPQEIEQLMQEINAIKTVAETTMVTEMASATTSEVAKSKQEETTKKEIKQDKTKSKKLPEIARPYGELVRLAFSRLTSKPDGNKYTAVWLSKELEKNGFSVPRKTIDNHKNFWAIPSRDYLQKMIDAGYAELIAVDKETLWKVWELSKQAWNKEKVARRFGDLLKKKREAAGYDQRSTMINDLIRDSRGELSQEQFKTLENNFSLYERYKGFPNEKTFKQLINAGFADKIGVSAEELETAWREARLARGEAKEMAKEARALVGGEAVTQELPVAAQEPVVEKEPVTAQEPVVEKEAVVEEEPVTAQEPVVEKEAVVETDPTPSSEVASESAPPDMNLTEIENTLKTLQEMQEKAPLPSVREVLDKEIEKLEHQWLVEEDQRQARVEKEVKTALEKVRADYEQGVVAVREQYSEQLGDRLDEIYQEVMRGS